MKQNADTGHSSNDDKPGETHGKKPAEITPVIPNARQDIHELNTNHFTNRAPKSDS